MPNSGDYVRKVMNTNSTPHDKGLEMTIKVVAYDNGLINVNGNPIGENRNDNQWLATSRFIAQMLEEFAADVARRRSQEAA